MAKIKLLTTPKAGMTEAKMTTIRSPKATVNSQKDCRTDFMLEGAYKYEFSKLKSALHDRHLLFLCRNPQISEGGFPFKLTSTSHGTK